MRFVLIDLQPSIENLSQRLSITMCVRKFVPVSGIGLPFICMKYENFV